MQAKQPTNQFLSWANMGNESGLEAMTNSPPNIGVGLSVLDGQILPQANMYTRCNFEPPPTPPDGFEVVVPGLKTRWIAPSDLKGYDHITVDILLECAGNGRTLMESVPEGTPWTLGGVSPVTVSGVRLSQVVTELPPEVVELVFTGADRGQVEPEGEINYQFSLDVETALSEVPLLVTHIGGVRLSQEHGAPVRLVVPGNYAMQSVKWLTRVEGVTESFDGHFVRKYRFYADDHEPEASPVGPIAVRSVISFPLGRVDAGKIVIMGSAWSGTGKIERVEVSTDGGRSWGSAAIDRSVSRSGSHVSWSYRATVERGALELVSRATDTSGMTQPLQPRWNANGYANNVVHRVDLVVN